jgi:hypothetical protein
MAEKYQGISWGIYHNTYHFSWCKRCKAEIVMALQNSVLAPVLPTSCNSYLHRHPNPSHQTISVCAKVATQSGNVIRWKLTNQSRLDILRQMI